MTDDQASGETDNEKAHTSRPRLKRLIIFLIVGVVIYLLLIFFEPKVSQPRSGRRPVAMNRLKNISLAQKNFASQSKGSFAAPTVLNGEGEPVFGWYVKLLPLVGDAERYEKIHFEYSYDHTKNAQLFKGSTTSGNELVPEIKQTTNTDGLGLIHFTLNERIFPNNRSLTEDFISRADGLGNTILLGEIEQGLPAWGAPGNARDPARGLKPGPNTFGVSVHGGTTIIGFADGRVITLDNDIDPAVLKALSTPDGGEVIPEDY